MAVVQTVALPQAVGISAGGMPVDGGISLVQPVQVAKILGQFNVVLQCTKAVLDNSADVSLSLKQLKEDEEDSDAVALRDSAKRLLLVIAQTGLLTILPGPHWVAVAGGVVGGLAMASADASMGNIWMAAFGSAQTLVGAASAVGVDTLPRYTARPLEILRTGLLCVGQGIAASNLFQKGSIWARNTAKHLVEGEGKEAFSSAATFLGEVLNIVTPAAYTFRAALDFSADLLTQHKGA